MKIPGYSKHITFGQAIKKNPKLFIIFVAIFLGYLLFLTIRWKT